VVEYTYDYKLELIDVEKNGFLILRKLLRTIMAEIKVRRR